MQVQFCLELHSENAGNNENRTKVDELTLNFSIMVTFSSVPMHFGLLTALRSVGAIFEY